MSYVVEFACIPEWNEKAFHEMGSYMIRSSVLSRVKHEDVRFSNLGLGRIEIAGNRIKDYEGVKEVDMKSNVIFADKMVFFINKNMNIFKLGDVHASHDISPVSTLILFSKETYETIRSCDTLDDYIFCMKMLEDNG